MASSDSQIDKPQCGHTRRAELPDVNIYIFFILRASLTPIWQQRHAVTQK